jgi:hypothetical protein
MSKTFSIRVTQDMTGYYEGHLEIEADNLEEAQAQLKDLSLKDIDDMVDWSHGDEYDGDYGSIELHDELEEDEW